MNLNPGISMLALLSLTILSPASPAAADWLVTVDGHKVETRGEWRVDGNRVLFELPTGDLVSMRASEVDLEASQSATAAEAEAARTSATESAEASPRPSVYRLTDADVGHVEDEDEPVAEGDQDAAASEPGALTVTDWTDTSEVDGDGTVIDGRLANQGEDTSSNVRLVVRLYDVEGRLTASSGAVLSAQALPPGDSTRFQATFPGVFDYSAVRFEAEGVDLVTERPALPQDDDGFAAAEGEAPEPADEFPGAGEEFFEEDEPYLEENET